MKRETLLEITRFLMYRLIDLSFVGLEHIPPQGGVIIATNHLSRLDIPTLFLNPVRPDITALIADKYKAYFFISWYAKVAGGIYIDRSKADFTAFREAVIALKQGRALGVAPEGTRSSSGGLLPGKAGTALLAIKAGVPIVPVGITGTEDSVKKLLRLQRPKITATFGPAFRLSDVPREGREEFLQKCTDEIMCRIAILMPDKYHGAYKGHPRLHEMRTRGYGAVFP